VLAQRRSRISVAQRASLLQQRHDLVGEPVQAAGGDVRDQDEAVARVRLDVLDQRLGDRGRSR
jgi:hypothetical protein